MPTSLGSWYQECHWHYLTRPRSTRKWRLACTPNRPDLTPAPFASRKMTRLADNAGTSWVPRASPVWARVVRFLLRQWLAPALGVPSASGSSYAPRAVGARAVV